MQGNLILFKKNWNEQACETLGNLCVSQMYDLTKAECAAYKDIATKRTSSISDK